MKKLLCFISLLAIAFIIANPSKISAQSQTDTVYIPGSSSLQISDIINADTSVTAPRVYVLDRGAIYYIEKAFEITHSCKFIAKGSAKRPPVLAVAIRADGSNEEWYFKFIKAGIKVELDDLYLLSMRSDGKTLGWSRGIWVGADSISLKLRRVVFDAFTEGAMNASGKWLKLDVQDCNFRNLQHSSSYFGGQAFLTDNHLPSDTTKFINNTFFACNSYIFSDRGYDRYSVFEHNTIAYGVVNPFLINRAQNIHVKNNLFYGANGWGGDPEQVIQGWMDSFPDTEATGLINLWKKGLYIGINLTGPESNNIPDMGIIFDPHKRVDEIVNNGYYFPDKLVNYYNKWNDTVTVYDSVTVNNGTKQYLKRKLTLAVWMNKTMLATLDSLNNPNQWDYSPYVQIANNMNANPGFTDAGVLGHVDSLIAYVNRIATRNLTSAWPYKLTFPPTWPLPENLAYSNTSMQSAGTDGFALGDLNWFPAQKQQWLVTDVKPVSNNAMPTEFNLSQNYPNPFNPTTVIKFSVPAKGNYTLRVFNVLGQEVAQLLSGQLNAGNYEATFNASKLSSGVYFYNLSGSNVNITKKMMLIK